MINRQVAGLQLFALGLLALAAGALFGIVGVFQSAKGIVLACDACLLGGMVTVAGGVRVFRGFPTLPRQLVGGAAAVTWSRSGIASSLATIRTCAPACLLPSLLSSLWTRPFPCSAGCRYATVLSTGPPVLLSRLRRSIWRRARRCHSQELMPSNRPLFLSISPPPFAPTSPICPAWLACCGL